jgi:hypothetical protein
MSTATAPFNILDMNGILPKVWKDMEKELATVDWEVVAALGPQTANVFLTDTPVNGTIPCVATYSCIDLYYHIGLTDIATGCTFENVSSNMLIRCVAALPKKK